MVCSYQAVMPECLYRASTEAEKAGFPLNACGNDAKMIQLDSYDGFRIANLAAGWVNADLGEG
jgi:hypothetical protein